MEVNKARNVDRIDSPGEEILDEWIGLITPSLYHLHCGQTRSRIVSDI